MNWLLSGIATKSMRDQREQHSASPQTISHLLFWIDASVLRKWSNPLCLQNGQMEVGGRHYWLLTLTHSFKPARSFGSKTANVTGISSIRGKIHCKCASCFYCKWLMVNANIGAECCVQNPHWAVFFFPIVVCFPIIICLNSLKMFTFLIIEE